MSADTIVSPTGALWAVRVLWVALAPAMAVAVADATADGPSVGRTAATVLWWLVVAAGVIAVVVPSTVSLTGARMVAPVTAVVAVVVLVGGAGVAVGSAALVVAVVLTAVVLSAEAGEAFVQASAYGHEQRLPLRVPAPVLPAAALVWLVWALPVVVAAVLVGNGEWVPGVLVAAAAVVLTWLAVRRLHVLARRWLVVVPAGVVVHDSLVLGETLMVQRPNVVAAHLALAGTDAFDLTGPAGGHAVEVVVRDTALVLFAATRAEPKGKAVHAQSFLVAPARPGRALRALAAAKVPVR